MHELFIMFMKLVRSLFSRSEAINKGVKVAIGVPMELLVIGRQCWPHLITLANHGNQNALSDLQVLLSVCFLCTCTCMCALCVYECSTCMLHALCMEWTENKIYALYT